MQTKTHSLPRKPRPKPPRTTEANGEKVKRAFGFQAPEAVSVMLVGDFTRWEEQPIALRRKPDGVWEAEIELAPGRYHYRFLVDGIWQDDPTCPLRVENGFGTQNCVCDVDERS
jgi:1,4-alpha-glucan branching enzyme